VAKQTHTKEKSQLPALGRAATTKEILRSPRCTVRKSRGQEYPHTKKGRRKENNLAITAINRGNYHFEEDSAGFSFFRLDLPRGLRPSPPLLESPRPRAAVAQQFGPILGLSVLSLCARLGPPLVGGRGRSCGGLQGVGIYLLLHGVSAKVDLLPFGDGRLSLSVVSGGSLAPRRRLRLAARDWVGDGDIGPLVVVGGVGRGGDVVGRGGALPSRAIVVPPGMTTMKEELGAPSPRS